MNTEDRMPISEWIYEQLQDTAKERQNWPEWLKTTRGLGDDGQPRRQQPMNHPQTDQKDKK